MKLIERIQNIPLYQKHPIFFIIVFTFAAVYGLMILAFFVLMLITGQKQFLVTGTPAAAIIAVLFVPSCLWISWESYKLCKKNKLLGHYVRCVAWGFFATFELIYSLCFLIAVITALCSGNDIMNYLHP